MRSVFFLTILRLLFFLPTIQAQTHFGDEWVTGILNYPSVIKFKNSVFQFDRYYDTVLTQSQWFREPSNICNSAGRAILVSNGYNVLDSNGNYVDGLDSIGGRDIVNYYGAAPLPQTSIFLPLSNEIYYFISPTASDSEFYLWQNVAGHDPVYDELLYCKIDMNANGGLGACIMREFRLLKNESLSRTQMMACKHANGKD